MLRTAVCDNCLHFNSAAVEMVCAAFPDGIPIDTAIGKNDHSEPYPGDGGIEFERLKDRRPGYIAWKSRRRR